MCVVLTVTVPVCGEVIRWTTVDRRIRHCDRSLGDEDMHRIGVSVPDVRELTLGPLDEILVLGSDGMRGQINEFNSALMAYNAQCAADGDAFPAIALQHVTPCGTLPFNVGRLQQPNW